MPGHAMKPVLYGIRYVMQRLLFKADIPLICGLVLTNKCNLHCRHCRIADRGALDLCFEEITRVIDSFYRDGGRCLYLEGGEPFLWRDRQYKLEDIVEYAHGIGFFTVIIYTNGTIPITTSADTVFVSIDGLEKTHNFLRGNTFTRIMGNIQESRHSSIYVNYTIIALQNLIYCVKHISCLTIPRIYGTITS
jgi:Fe-coproporphyrin III synthase